VTVATTKRKTRTFVQDLPVPLSGIEKSDRREKLEAVELKLDALAAERDLILEGLNDRKKKLELERKDLLAGLKNGHEQRPVDCEERFDLDRWRAVIVRLDTGDEIEERAITASERESLSQEPMFDGAGGNGAPESRA
jgi:hypothetical protein